MSELSPSFFAPRMSRFATSASQQATQRARELEAEGRRIVKLTAGEPDFPTPDNVKWAVVRAMERNDTKYTPVAGTLELRKVVAAKFAKDNGLDYGPGDIFIGSGAKQVISNALAATVDEGDEVIIPAPYWTSYPDMVSMWGGTPVKIACGQNNAFRMRPDQLAEAITPKTKWLILCSPSNPTGSTYTREELQALADVLLEHPHVYILTDDIYEHLIFDGHAFNTIAAVEPRLKDRTLTVNGVSKAYSMTGWRVGYCGGPTQLIKMMAQVQSQASSGISSISQAAAVEALTGPQGYVAERTADLQRRRDLLHDYLIATPGITCHKPEGAMYIFANVAGLIGKTTPDGQVLETDSDVTLYLLMSVGVAVVQGAAYGLSPYLRMSFVTSDAELHEAGKLIRQASEALR